MYYLVQTIWQRGMLRKVIAVSKNRCRYEFDLRLVETLPGEGRLVSGLAQIKEKVWSEFPSRWLGEVIFDRYATLKLPKPAGILVTTPRLIRTARQAKTLGYKTLLYGGHAHPGYLSTQIRQEQETFGLHQTTKNYSRAWQMARFTTHVEQSDYILAVSEFAKNTYIQQGVPSEKIFVVPLGVDIHRFRPLPLPETNDFTCLFIAHVDGSTGILKGLPYLLQAWSELGLKNARLLVCGKLGLEARALVRRFESTLHNVQFTGPVSNPEAYYQQASVFVFPTLAEGLAKVVLEAMASGRPVITTPVLSPVVRENIDGFYVPLRDTEALKDRILYYYQHRDELRRMGANAGEQARQFTWDRFSQRVADIMEEIAT